MNKDKKIYEKINQAVRLLCDVYEILNEEHEEIKTESGKLFKISQFLELHPEYTAGQIRNYIFQNINNFNEKVTVRIARNIFIKEKDFFRWLKGEI